MSERPPFEKDRILQPALSQPILRPNKLGSLAGYVPGQARKDNWAEPPKKNQRIIPVDRSHVTVQQWENEDGNRALAEGEAPWESFTHCYDKDGKRNKHLPKPERSHNGPARIALQTIDEAFIARHIMQGDSRADAEWKSQQTYVSVINYDRSKKHDGKSWSNPAIRLSEKAQADFKEELARIKLAHQHVILFPKLRARWHISDHNQQDNALLHEVIEQVRAAEILKRAERYSGVSHEEALQKAEVSVNGDFMYKHAMHEPRAAQNYTLYEAATDPLRAALDAAFPGHEHSDADISPHPESRAAGLRTPLHTRMR